MMHEILSKIKSEKTLEGLKILIWGIGVTGKALHKVCEKFGADTWYTDKEYKGLHKFIPDDEVIESNQNFDLILKSPGVPWIDQLAFFRNSDTLIIGEMELISLLDDTPIIAITGSNGKTTTCTMLKEAFDLLDKKTFLGGNIGIPYSEILNGEYEFAILEVSSFQLELIETFRPEVAVILNVFENHMERYDSLDEYKQAKFNIFKNFDSNDKLIIANELRNDLKVDFFVKFLNHGSLDFSKMKVVGDHNKLNFQAVFEVLTSLDLNTFILDELIENFLGIDHRIQFVHESNGVSYYNDSKSTNLVATMTALKSFKDQSQIALMLGGQLRDNDVSSYQEILSILNKDQIFLYGESKDLLSKEFDLHRKFESFEEILNSDDLKNYSIVLLSPGFPSYDQFSNFTERGADFIKKVNLNEQ